MGLVHAARGPDRGPCTRGWVRPEGPGVSPCRGQLGHQRGKRRSRAGKETEAGHTPGQGTAVTGEGGPHR